jgi:hypothetical protein
MADFNIQPVASQIKPVQGQSLGDMINLARGAQQYQQAQQINPLELQQKQQATRTSEIALGVEEQKNTERMNFQSLMSNPEAIMTEGRFDPAKFTSMIPKIMPLTGVPAINDLTNLAKSQTEAFSAKRNLDQGTRQIIASKLGLLGRAGVTNPTLVANELNNLIVESNNDPEVKRLVSEAYLPIFSKIPPEGLPDALIKSGQSLWSTKEQQATLAPTITTTEGGKTVTTQPSVGAAPPTSTMGLAGQTNPYEYKDTGKFDPISNQPIYEVRDKQSGELIGQLIKAPEKPKQPAGFTTAPTIPAGESAETGATYQTQINTAREAGVPSKTAVNNIDTILKFLPMAQTGKGSEALAGLQSIVGNIAGSKPEELAAAARDIIQKNIVDLALQKNAALGGKFASSLDASLASLAQAEKNPTAITKNLEQLRPLVQHPYNYTVGLDRAVEKSPKKQFVKPEFDAAMNDAFDLKALMLKNAYDLGGEEGLNKYKKTNKINLVEQQKLVNKLERYQALVNGDLERYKALTDKEK